MNAFDTFTGGKAKLRYLDADFEIIRHGSYVECAVTHKRIDLDNLKYWSVDRQEAYYDAAAAFSAYQNQRTSQ
ncbi:MAG: DUF2093 domain-containing protein [bacterium]